MLTYCNSCFSKWAIFYYLRDLNRDTIDSCSSSLLTQIGGPWHFGVRQRCLFICLFVVVLVLCKSLQDSGGPGPTPDRSLIT